MEPNSEATKVSPPPWEPPGAGPFRSPESPSGPGRPGASLDFSDLFEAHAEPAPTRRVEAVEYIVRNREGMLIGSFDQVSLRAHLQIGRLSGTEEASTDGGRSFRPLPAFPELADVLAAAARQRVSTDLARVETAPARAAAAEVVRARERDLAEQVASTIQAPRAGGIESRAQWQPSGAEFQPTIAPPPQEAPPPPPSSIPRPAERPAWLAPAVTAKAGRQFTDAREVLRRRRLVLIAAAGLAVIGGGAALLLWDPGFEGEEAIRKKIALDEAHIRRYRAQARELLQVGTFRAYAEARTKLASVVKSDPNDRRAKAMYLQALIYLLREFGQVAVGKEVEKVRRDLDRAGERDVEFQKAKAAHALWKGDAAAALRYLDRVVAAQPDDREAQYLQAVALTGSKGVDAAVKVFDKILAADPKSAKALRGKAEALLLADRAAGIATLRKVVEMAPSHAGASLRLAEIYFEDGRREDAKRLFAWVVDPRAPARREAAPDELARASSYLGRIAFEDRDLGAARQYLETALQLAASDAERVRALLALGDVLVELRDFKSAVARLEVARQKVPDSPDVLARIAVAYVGTGQSSKARQSVVEGLKVIRTRRVDELSPAARTQHYLEAARLRLASAAVNEGDEIPRLGEAIDDYRATVDLAEKAAGKEGPKLMLQARVRLAALLRRQKNLAGAIAELEAARKIDPDAAAVHNGFGEVYADQGQAGKAEAEFRKALASDGRFLQARFNLADLLSDQGKVAEALKQLDAIAKVDPGYPGLSLSMAIAYQRQRRFADAIAAFEQAVKANPDDPRVYLRIGIAYFHLGGEENLGKARTYLDRAIEKNRQLNEAYYYRGRAVLALGKPETALDDFKTAVEREPDNGVYRIYYGAAFEQAGAVRDAMFQYNRAIELLREQKNEVDIALALYRRGRLRLERDEIPAALQDLEEALKYDSANTEVLVLLGDSLAQARRHKLAVERYRAALARGKRIKGLWFKLGRSLLEINQRAEAMRALNNAANEDPSDCYPHYYLGYLYKDAKQEAQAIRSLKRFLALCKTPPERKDVARDIFDMERRLGLHKE